MAKEEKANAKVAKAKDAKVKAKKKGPNRIVKYLRDLKSEIKKVVWPSRKQVLNNTGIVLAVMVIMGVFLACVDYGLSFLVELLLGIDL
ncbi:MAG: preprotein translocase subunit SecE [Ruminococcus sp.]|nr:preprotein translocase subunit SecE [Ruminococcus sp.]